MLFITYGGRVRWQTALRFMSVQGADTDGNKVLGAYRLIGSAKASALDGLRLYDAEHLHRGHKVVVRLLSSPSSAVDDPIQKRLLERLGKLAGIRSPHVLVPVDAGVTEEGCVYAVMERPEGDPLAVVQGSLKEKVFPGVRSRDIARQIAAALGTAADAGLGDRPLTARDIFVAVNGTPGDRVKIDLATPERLGATAASDVQVLGRLLYQMVVGTLPASVEDEAPLDPTLIRTDLEIPADLDALIMRALDPDPRKRWPNLAEMSGALAVAAARATMSQMATDHPDGHLLSWAPPEIKLWGRSFPRPSRPLVAGGVAALAALGFIAALGVARLGTGNSPQQATGPSPMTVAAAAVAETAGKRNPAPAPFLASAATTSPDLPVPLAKSQPVTVAIEGPRAIGPCAVTLSSEPWSEVHIDGKHVGFTPLLRHVVDCGAHEVLFKSPQWNLEKHVSIVVSPGHVLGKVVDLMSGDTRASASEAEGMPTPTAKE